MPKVGGATDLSSTGFVYFGDIELTRIGDDRINIIPNQIDTPRTESGGYRHSVQLETSLDWPPSISEWDIAINGSDNHLRLIWWWEHMGDSPQDGVLSNSAGIIIPDKLLIRIKLLARALKNRVGYHVHARWSPFLLNHTINASAQNFSKTARITAVGDPVFVPQSFEHAESGKIGGFSVAYLDIDLDSDVCLNPEGAGDAPISADKRKKDITLGSSRNYADMLYVVTKPGHTDTDGITQIDTVPMPAAPEVTGEVHRAKSVVQLSSYAPPQYQDATWSIGGQVYGGAFDAIPVSIRGRQRQEFGPSTQGREQISVHAIMNFYPYLQYPYCRFQDKVWDITFAEKLNPTTWYLTLTRYLPAKVL